MKEKNILDLCFKYNQSCKKCPRYNKCQKELEKEEHKKVGGKYERFSTKNNNNMCNNTNNTFWK